MRAWTSATAKGRCSADFSHDWNTGDRIYTLQGPAGWKKFYCGDCARSRFNAPEDTGEIIELEDQANYPRPLKALADQIRERFQKQFDVRMAAAEGRSSE